MKKTKHYIDVVFVAACDSQDIGNIFGRNGVEHVVCVESERFVLDSAAIDFTKTFYQLIFNGEDICAAFYQAKESTKFTQKETEADLFILLING